MRSLTLVRILRPALPVLAVLLWAAGPGTAAPGTAYHVQPGDILSITLWNVAEIPTDVKVDGDGNIAFADAGIISVKGLTTDEISERLTAALQKQFKSPRLTVALKAMRPDAGIYLLGAVLKPGPIEFVEGMKVRDALGIAGGLAPGADGAHGTLNGPKRATLSLDLNKILLQADAPGNVALAPGDVINVPAVDLPAPKDMMSVFAFGQVNRPGPVQVSVGAHVSDAIAAAGGPSQTADLQKATLSRGGLTTNVDLYAILRKGDMAANTALQQGDVLLIPETHNVVSLLGAFQRPGNYPFNDGSTIMEALALGGGPNADADLRHCVLRRGEQETAVDLQALLTGTLLNGNQTIKDGDRLFIPQRPRTQVTIMGEVTKPGTYPFKEDDTVSQAIVLAQGVTPQADPKLAVLKRGGKEIPVDLKALFAGDMKDDVPLKDGDVLVVPPGRKVLAYGAFQKPGVLTVTSDMTLVDVIAAAGGCTKDARAEKAYVVRVSADNKPTQTQLDLKRAIEKGTGREFAFHTGDVLFVPEKGKGIDLGTVLSTVTTMTVLGNYMGWFNK